MSAYTRDLALDLAIDKHSLEIEAANQPTIYGYWSEELSKAKEQKDSADIQLKVLRAETDIDYRQNPPEGLKVTEAIVLAHIDANPALRRKMDELNSLRKSIAYLEGAVKAIEQKKSMIETLSRLWLGGYYSSPDRETAAGQSNRQALKRKHTEEEED